MLSAIFHELRQALRSLSSHFGFSMLVVGVLASGLACVIFMLVMINGLVLRPLPFPEPDRLLHAGVTDGSNDGRLTDVSGRDLLELRRRLTELADVAGYESATDSMRSPTKLQLMATGSENGCGRRSVTIPTSGCSIDAVS